VVYTARRPGGSALWYRSLSDATARRIEGTDRGERPTISPDGSRLAFLRYAAPPQWTLEVEPIGGGAPSTLGTGTGEVNLQWLSDGRLQVLEGDANHMRWFDPGGGPTTGHGTLPCVSPFDAPGPSRVLCSLDYAYLADLTDSVAGRRVLWTGSGDSTQVFGSDFRVIDGRYLVYLSLSGDLQAAPVNLDTRRVGRSVRLVTGIDRSAFWGGGAYAISRSGTLVYAQGPNREIGNLVATDGRSFDTLDVGRDAFLRYSVSSDGHRLAAVVQGPQGDELRIYDLRTGEPMVWVRHLEIGQPVWNPRGDSVAFTMDGSLFVGDPDRSQAPEPVSGAPRSFNPAAWVSRGSLIVGNAIFGGGSARRVVAVGLDVHRQPATWDTLATDAIFPTVSPAGRWLAYNDLGLGTLWIAPLPFTGQRYQVASGFVAEPRWRSDRELAFSLFGGPFGLVPWAPTISTVDVDVSGPKPTFHVGSSLEMPGYAETAGLSWQLMPDGRVLYVRSEPDEPKHFLRVVPHWVAQMERAVDEANK
jgi:hypothetical protein